MKKIAFKIVIITIIAIYSFFIIYNHTTIKEISPNGKYELCIKVKNENQIYVYLKDLETKTSKEVYRTTTDYNVSVKKSEIIWNKNWVKITFYSTEDLEIVISFKTFDSIKIIN